MSECPLPRRGRAGEGERQPVLPSRSSPLRGEERLLIDKGPPKAARAPLWLNFSAF